LIEPRSGPEVKIRDLYKPPEKTSLSHFFKCLTEGTEKNPIIGDLRGTFGTPKYLPLKTENISVQT
jgi:hypothetical protein